MKVSSLIFSGLMLIGLIGCNTRSEPGGGADKASQVTLRGPGATTVKQGETQTVTLKVERGKEFKQTVKLKADAPTGIVATLGENSVKASEKGEVTLKIAASEKAPTGNHIIQVTGTPDAGSVTTLELKINVADRAETVVFSLSGPLTATSIKQGETQTIPLTLKHQNKNPGNIKLVAENSDQGINAQLTSTSIKSNDSGDVGLKVTADKTASLGEHTIRVSGNANSGKVTPVDVKVKVIAP